MDYNILGSILGYPNFGNLLDGKADGTRNGNCAYTVAFRDLGLPEI